MNILIIGTGLIGGSFALATKAHFDKHRLGGWDLNVSHMSDAKKLGIIDTYFASEQEAFSWMDLAVLSIPVSAIRKNINRLLGNLNGEQSLIDFGSTKKTICDQVRGHPNRSQYLAAHPIAGTEYSGPKAADAGLFMGKHMLTCEVELSNNKLVDWFGQWCSVLGMTVKNLSPSKHDQHLAYISHLSHVIAFGLSNTVLEKEKNGEAILELSGSGFASTVRLAKSDPVTWAEIFMENRTSLIKGIDELTTHIQSIRTFLANGQYEKIRDFLEKGRKIRKILK